MLHFSIPSIIYFYLVEVVQEVHWKGPEFLGSPIPLAPPRQPHLNQYSTYLANQPTYFNFRNWPQWRI